jgi:cell wall-associated NlpC family hydrolase
MTASEVGTTLPDRRRHPWREDLAAVELKGVVPAPRFVEGTPARVSWPAIALRRAPSGGGSFETEALFGERLTVFDEADGWAWVQRTRDRYVGYVPRDALSFELVEATHRVQALGTFVYPRADIKAPPITHLPLGAEIAVKNADARFAELATGGFVVLRHICERSWFARDFVDVAERFIGVPYLWGGRTRMGLDCSGLVQIALEAAGLPCPRDSDMQEAELGSAVLVPSNLEGLTRGDFVFWPGHVGVMVDSVMLLHANAFHMAVSVEPLEPAADRIARQDDGECRIRSIRRLDRLSAMSEAGPAKAAL